MKFLVLTTRRQNVPVPSEAIARILNAQREWFEEHRGPLPLAPGEAQGERPLTDRSW